MSAKRSAPRTLGDFGRHLGRIGVLAFALGVGGPLAGGLGTAQGAPDGTANTSEASSSASDETTTTSQSAQTAAAPASNEQATIDSTGTSGSDEPTNASSTIEDSALDAELPADEASTPPVTEIGSTATSESPPELEESTGNTLASTDGYTTTIDEEVVSPSASAGTDPADAAGPADSGIAGLDTGVPVDTAAVVTDSGAAAHTYRDADVESSGTSSSSPGVVAAVASPDIAEAALAAMNAVAVSAVTDAVPDGALENDESERSAPLADSDHWTRGAATPAAGAAAAPADSAQVPVVPGSVPVIKRVLAGVLGLFGVEVPSGEAPLNPFAPDFLTQLAFAAWQRVRFLLGDTATTTSPTIASTDPAVDSSPSATAALAVAAPSDSASYTLTGIDFDSGLVSGVLDVDPVAVARYEISGGLKGTVTLVDNAFEYRPTAQAQEAASAPDAGYEELYDNFDVLAIGIGGTATESATRVHVDVPVLGTPASAPPPSEPTPPPGEPTPPPTDPPSEPPPPTSPPGEPTPPPTDPTSPPSDPSNSIVYKLDMLDFAPFLEGDGDVFGSTLDAETVQQRLDLVAPYTNGIRTFSAYNSKDLVRLAHQMGMTVYAGAWIDAGNDSLVGADGRTQAEVEVDELIGLANEGYVDVAIVGSESIYHGHMQEARVVELMERFRAGSTNSDVQVVTALKAETLLNTIPGREGQVDPEPLINAGDFVYYNTYPFWSGISINNALDRLKWEHQQIVGLAGGKAVQISETGWPSYTDPDNPNGAAVGNPENAQRYFDEVTTWAAENGVFLSWFGSFDLPSRSQSEGPSLSGAYWGIWDHTGDLKAAYEAVFTDSAPPPVDPSPPPSETPPPDPTPPPSASASYTLTGIDFDSGLVSGLLDVDPVTVERYEVSGGLRGTVTFLDNAFEYRPTAEAQVAASAPGAGYEALYDSFDVLAIGIDGAATKVHVDVAVLGAPAPSEPPSDPLPPDDPTPPPNDPPPPDPTPPPSASASYTLSSIDFDSGSVSGLLDVDPTTVARYEISGGLKGTVTLIDNAFEYRPTAEAQEAASAPDAGYEALYDNFDVLAIGIGGAATGSVTKIHVDVPVLGASTPASNQL